MLTRKIHRTTAIIIGAFALLHIGIHLFAIGGIEQHIAVMNSLRVVYRNRKRREPRGQNGGVFAHPDKILREKA